MTKKVSYVELDSTLQQLEAHVSAAEVHGLLTGMLSLIQSKDAAVWRAALVETLDCKPPTKKQWTILSNVSAQILADFSKMNFGFKPLLPDDEAALEQRVTALGYWCRGYLSGLGLVGLTGADLKNPIIKELIHDLSQIAHVNSYTSDSEEDELNYMELVEYVRIAVQNIHVELIAADQKQILH